MGVGLLQHASAHPDRVALTIGRRDYTYQEAANTALRWAALLVEVTGGRPRRVGVFAYCSEASYLGVAAALFAGATFVPLNRKFPLSRTRAMLERADVDALIVDAASLSQLPELLRGLTRQPAVLIPDTPRTNVVHLGEARVLDADDLSAAAPLDRLPEVSPSDPAYLLFTSGSTGQPKGVPVTHANVRAFLDVNQDRYRLTPDDRLTQTFDQTFDLSVFDLFMAWENGARVCSMEPIELLAPFKYLERNEITVWFSVPSVAAVLRKRGVLKPGTMPTLRWSLFCGEALPRATAEAWQAAAPQSIVENLYGPTELTIACTAYRWDPESSPAECVHDNVPIGALYPGLHALIVDPLMTPEPDGGTGELCVAGPQTAPGYWQAPQLTAERFFEYDGRTYYRTGDLVRSERGQFVYLGRNDQQVKIGGHRVELGEIEAVLRRAGAVEAVSLLWPDAVTITAVVSGTEDLAALADACTSSLPAYMVPASVQVIEEMPVNCNGKVDREALRQWLGNQADHVLTRHSDVPEDSIMNSVDQLIASTLDIAEDRVTDGLEYQSISEWDSLGHVSLMVALEGAFGVTIDDELIVTLRSVEAIREFASGATPVRATANKGDRATVRRGLEGVAFDHTSITHIDGAGGTLEYRGYSIHDLAEHASFEEVASLLVDGELPDADALEAFEKELRAARYLPEPVLDLARSLAHVHPVEALRTCVSALGAFGPQCNQGTDETYEQAREAGIALMAQIPMIVAAHHAFRSGRELLMPAEETSYADAFLTALLGERPTPAAVRFINKGFIVHADHSSNASAFTARVVIGCRAGMTAALTAAIAAFGGSVHGGAAERVVDLIDQVGSPELAEAYVAELHRRGEPVMGFGHRVYKTVDPRVRHLRATVVELSKERGDTRGLDILDAVAAAMQPYNRHGVAANVDLYAGLAYRLLGLPGDLAIPMFVVGRTAGWVAQALEQQSNNVLIRPLLDYVGPHGREFPKAVGEEWAS